MTQRARAALLAGLAGLVGMAAWAEKPRPRRFVERSELVSTELPKIRVRVAAPFQYVGTFHFTIRNAAQGDRYVFVDAPGRRVERMFIAQFEEYLPHSKGTYRYSFENAQLLGGQRFKPNTFAFSTRADAKQNPQNEGVLTTKFLEQKGYTVDDELMAARFVTVPDKERRHELILFYVENVKSAGHTLRGLYEREKPTALWTEMGKGLMERAIGAFRVMD